MCKTFISGIVKALEWIKADLDEKNRLRTNLVFEQSQRIIDLETLNKELNIKNVNLTEEINEFHVLLNIRNIEADGAPRSSQYPSLNAIALITETAYAEAHSADDSNAADNANSDNDKAEVNTAHNANADNANDLVQALRTEAAFRPAGHIPKIKKSDDYKIYHDWLKYTDWEKKPVDGFNSKMFILTMIKLILPELTPLKTIQEKTNEEKLQNNKNIMYKHFKLGFKFFNPRMYLKEIVTKYEYFYVLTFWCLNRQATNKAVCLCQFYNSVKLLKNVKNTPEFIESFIKQNKFGKKKTFPYICEKQPDTSDDESDEE